MNGGLTARRLGIAAFCVLSLVVCLGLAWWQFRRYESASGDWQNFGYMLLWPIFGVFPTFMVWRMRRLRAEDAATAAPEQPAKQTEPAPPPRPRPVVRHDDDDDPELAAYNRYLAQLNALDQQEKTP